MTAPEVFFSNPNSLTPHPLLASIPMLDEASPEFQALKASIRDRGVDYAVIVDENDRILDGRNRTRAAAQVGAELPCVMRSSAEASEIILSSLLNRRHLPKGALAYLSAPLFATAVESGRARKLANLKSGDSSRKPIESTIGKTVEQLADEMGFGRDLFFQAVKVRALFEKTEVRDWRDGSRTVSATFRGWFEPKILSGEIGLGGVIQAIAGKESTEGQPCAKRDLATLLRRGFCDLHKRFSRWEGLEPDTRRELTAEIATEATTWPEDVRQRVLAALEKAAAHPRARAQF